MIDLLHCVHLTDKHYCVQVVVFVEMVTRDSVARHLYP